MASVSFSGVDEDNKGLMKISTKTFNYTFSYRLLRWEEPPEELVSGGLLRIVDDKDKLSSLLNLMRSQLQRACRQSTTKLTSLQMVLMLQDLITKALGWASEMNDIRYLIMEHNSILVCALIRESCSLEARTPSYPKVLERIRDFLLLTYLKICLRMQQSQSTRTSNTNHPSHTSNRTPSSSSYNENPRISLTRPKTSILLPHTIINYYQCLLSLSPSSDSIQTTLSTLPPELLKKPFRNPYIPSFIYNTPIFRFFLERSRDKLPNSEICELCPLHERLLEAPLVHLQGLIGYEMYTHLQSLMNMHPSQRSVMTNNVLQKLYPWQDRRFCEPGTKVVGCLACELGRLYQDSRAMESLSVVAKSGRRGKAGIVQLVDEGWLGRWGDSTWGLHEVRADRRKAHGSDSHVNAEWRGGISLRGKGEVEWKEKKGFVLSHASSRVERPTRTQRHSVQGERPAPSRRHSVFSHSPSRAERPAPARGYSVRDNRPAYVAPPVRPDRPQGLTLSMFGKQENRVQWAREQEKTIKRKPVPVPNDEKKDRERKTLSTATTVVGSPKNRRSASVWHSQQPDAVVSPKNQGSSSVRHSHQPAASAAFSSRAPHNKPVAPVASSSTAPNAASASSSSSRAAHRELEPHANPPAANQSHAARPPSSVYSQTQGFRSGEPKHIFRSQSTTKPPRRTHAPRITAEQESQLRMNTTQQTNWSDFNRSNLVPASSAPSHTPASSRGHGGQKMTTKTDSTIPRRTKTMHAIGKKIAAGEYHWWETNYSESEDEKVVVPSLSRRNLKAHAAVASSSNSQHTTNINYANQVANNANSDDSEPSNSDYSGDEDAEEIRQRYLDEHEALLRMAQGVQGTVPVPRTADYLNTLPERPVDMTTVQPLKVGGRGQVDGDRVLRPGMLRSEFEGTDDGYERTVRRGMDRSSPWL
ncbi:MAG: hypothetical protein Q9204_003183 [Flavoplaca sp. TL-2023a]